MNKKFENKNDDNLFEGNKNNPFAKECKDCIKNIWEKLQQETNSLEQKCYSSTYVWIEKLKDDDEQIK